jgi:ADP-ribose pyrophosphatase YjhB (NUDIX family)
MVMVKHTMAKVWRKLNMPKGLQLRIMRATNDEFLVGVTGIIINKKAEVLVIKHTYRQTPWSLPGGYLKKGEHPRGGLAREIKEEIGLDVKVTKIIRTVTDSGSARLDIACYGHLAGGKFIPSAEASHYGFFHPDALPPIGQKQRTLVKQVLTAEKKYTPKKTKKHIFQIVHSLFKKASAFTFSH